MVYMVRVCCSDVHFVVFVGRSIARGVPGVCVCVCVCVCAGYGRKAGAPIRGIIAGLWPLAPLLRVVEHK
jgi:hypothetical protein